ncbi:TPA: hypothetical protein MO487_000349 [Salmonella enterica subsp. houtenae serovar 43:z4,z23:-]|nr:hypothetical protein [Salmonella enterica subsp. houtenae serovar 40:z4,z24:-]EDX6934847.1 hypothetical protein [Salmonella enterica subsp. houtenae serovar 40:z4,z24:-]EGH3481580.1 hypothetical protein [Salmonella enterica]EMC3044747.1 hypothetical protein [Salmonella enterica]HCA3674603.1 hypothetical protein [Salmonella enterica subsp. houtenae serovar Houten]
MKIFIAFCLVAIVVLLMAQRYTRLEFVSHAKLLFKTWSVWLASMGAMLGAWIQSFPDAAIQAWTLLPEDIKGYIPHDILGYISQVIVVIAVLAQFVRQSKLKDKAAEMRESK